MAEQVNVPVPEEMEQIVDMLVLSNGRWLTGTGGDVEYVKTLTSSVALLKRKVDLAVVTDSQDTTSERDGRTRDVAEMRGAVELMQDWVTEAESVATQLFEIVEVIRLVAQKRIQERFVEETVGVPVPHVMEEIVGVVRQEISVLTETIEEQAPKLIGGCAAHAPEWKEPTRTQSQRIGGRSRHQQVAGRH